MIGSPRAGTLEAVPRLVQAAHTAATARTAWEAAQLRGVAEAPDPLQMTSFLNRSRFGGAGGKFVRVSRSWAHLKSQQRHMTITWDLFLCQPRGHA